MLFASLEEASEFFREGATGYSARRDRRFLDGLELQAQAWKIEPAIVWSAASSYFDDPRLYPPGTAVLDNALVMRDIPARLRRRPRLDTHPHAEETPNASYQ